MNRELKIRNLEEKMMSCLSQLEKVRIKEVLKQFNHYKRQYYSMTQSHFNPARYAEQRGEQWNSD